MYKHAHERHITHTDTHKETDTHEHTNNVIKV